MNVRKRITDYPAIFWAALIATIVGGWMSVHAYKAMIHADDALIRSIGMFVVLECVSIFAAATMNTKGQGLLVGLAFVLIFGCAGTEIFLGASELQRGVMQMTETAKAASASTANGTANASALATAQEGLKGCQTRYPRKKKDAQARAECSKPYEKSIAALTAGEPAKTVAFDPEAAGMLALWQGITDAYNTMMGKEGEEVAKVEQVAFIAMLSIFTVFVIGKLFLWSKYAAWKTANYGDDYQAVTVPEQAIGSRATAQNERDGDEPHPAMVALARDFARAQNAREALYGRAANALDNMHVSSSKPTSNMHVEHAHVRHEHVEHAHVNNMHVGSDNDAYMHVTSAKVGTTCNCPQCGTEFRKANKWHTFCNPKCRDNWHNDRDPNRRAYLAKKRK